MNQFLTVTVFTQNIQTDNNNCYFLMSKHLIWQKQYKFFNVPIFKNAKKITNF